MFAIFSSTTFVKRHIMSATMDVKEIKDRNFCAQTEQSSVRNYLHVIGGTMLIVMRLCTTINWILIQNSTHILRKKPRKLKSMDYITSELFANYVDCFVKNVNFEGKKFCLIFVKIDFWSQDSFLISINKIGFNF